MTGVGWAQLFSRALSSIMPLCRQAICLLYSQGNGLMVFSRHNSNADLGTGCREAQAQPPYCCAHKQPTTVHTACRCQVPCLAALLCKWQHRRKHASTELLQRACVQKGCSPGLRHGIAVKAEYLFPRSSNTVGNTARSRQRLHAALHVWQLGENQQMYLRSS